MIMEMISHADYYLDACVRDVIENCVIQKEDMWAGMVLEVYSSAYSSMYRDGALELFDTGERPTVAKLGLLNCVYIYDLSRVEQKLSKFKYPVVKIIEYGENENYCLFQICSATGVGVWGIYVLNLESGNITRLDKDSIGKNYSIGGYLTYTYGDIATVDLSLAIDLWIDADYKKIVATVPYYSSYLDYNRISDTFSPIYSDNNVLVYDIDEGTCNAICGAYSRKPIYPAGAAGCADDVIYYPTKDGTWCFNGKIEFSGDFARISEVGNDKYAVMKQDGVYRVYRLSDGKDVTNDALSGRLLFNIINTYLIEGNERVNIITGERVVLYDSTLSAAVVSSKDNRYIYLYSEGGTEIVCIDIVTMSSDSLPVSETFIEHALDSGSVTYR